MAKNSKARINNRINSPELLVINEDGEKLGVISLQEALNRAEEADLDLVEIAPDAEPPVAKIMSYGKYQYDQKKKLQKAKAKAHVVETKSIQIKPGTGENDLKMKAKRVSNWLKKGNRVRVELFLRGRSKYMEREFLEKRLQRVLDLVEEPYKIADGPQKSPKGLILTVEQSQSSKKEKAE
ncbi:MAG: translation initiation factor IF-3 [Patescibacteria group bacterium]